MAESNLKAEVIEANDALSAKDYKRALSLLLPLVEVSDSGALSLLGVMYQLGVGVELDGLKAIELLKKAVNLGDGVAAHNLGTIYGMGMPNVPKNAKLSKSFYQQAKNMGFQCAPNEFYE